MKKAELFFITGVNGAGKSTLVPLLRKKVSSACVVYDFDERGVPENVDAKWRQKETGHWIDVGIRNSAKHKLTIICGLAMPAEVYPIAKQRNGIRIRMCVLDLGAPSIRARLRRRFSVPQAVRRLKKVTGLTVRECIQANIGHARELRRQCTKYKCKVFDTSRTTPERTADKIARWITMNS